MKRIRCMLFIAMSVSSAYSITPWFKQCKDNVQPKSKKPRILHVSYHLGCIKEVEYVARKLDLDVTSQYILDHSLKGFGSNRGGVIYNMFPERAQLIWEANKDYFNQFDIIWTSDIAPLSRIFLQNNWQKPLIIWICNRFDYFHIKKADPAYYKEFKQAVNKDNVWVISYTPYEWYHALKKGIDVGLRMIKPIGYQEDSYRYNNQQVWSVPSSVNKTETILIHPRVQDERLHYVKDQCKQLGIKTYAGRYNGPYDLREFKGILYFIYEPSNLCLFENIRNGLVHFLPSLTFLRELQKDKQSPFFDENPPDSDLLRSFNEWYCKDHEDLVVYYDSWKDLKHKIETTDYEGMRKRMKAFAQRHEQIMINRWRELFEEVNAYRSACKGNVCTNAD